jgi:hypothetical protein
MICSTTETLVGVSPAACAPAALPAEPNGGTPNTAAAAKALVTTTSAVEAASASAVFLVSFTLSPLREQVRACYRPEPFRY